jgi:hypothetical protein
LQPPRRLKILTPDELVALSEARLLSYRKKVLSLENSPEESDYEPAEVAGLDLTYIWFKSDPRWNDVYQAVLQALSQKQGRR